MISNVGFHQNFVSCLIQIVYKNLYWFVSCLIRLCCKLVKKLYTQYDNIFKIIYNRIWVLVKCNWVVLLICSIVSNGNQLRSKPTLLIMFYVCAKFANHVK